jgi:hypothetical protein
MQARAGRWAQTQRYAVALRLLSVGAYTLIPGASLLGKVDSNQIS